MTLTLIAKILPPLFAVGIGVYITWCQAIAFVGGTIPPFGWQLEGGFLTGMLWAVFVTGTVSGVARLVWRYLLAALGKVIPLTVATPAQPLSSPGENDSGNLPPPPDGVAAGYESAFACLCAVASQLVYAPDDQVQKTGSELKAQGVSLIVEQNHRCLLLAYADCIIVAFRGTDAGDIADWKTNMQRTPVPGPFGLVHGGYLAAVELLWPRITASLQQLRDGEQSLLLTGHSMGGALAVVATAKFAAEGAIPVAGLYTFGQPAVADSAFEAELSTRIGERYFRFVNSVDMVPGIYVDTAFNPGGQPLFIDRVGRVHTTNVLSRMASVRLLTAVLEPDTRRAELDDHGIAEYVRALTRRGPEQRSGPGIRGLTPRERVHFWISAALFAMVFVAFCVLTWNADGADAFGMGSGAAFTLALLGFMCVWPQEYNDHLLHWYTRQGLVPR